MPRSWSRSARAVARSMLGVSVVVVSLAMGALPGFGAGPESALPGSAAASQAALPGSAAASQAPLDRLLGSLLTADDLPGFTGRTLEDPSDLDIDRLAFDAHRGIAHVARAWVHQEQGVVFDQRMLFPTPGTALAYLVEAEPTLSEADDAGLALVPDDPLTPATRHWAGEALIGAEPVAMDVWLIPVGPVVAKVAATVFGPALPDRRVIGERALARLEAAYGPAGISDPWASPGTAGPSGSRGAAPTTSRASELEGLQALLQAVLRTGVRDCDGTDATLAGEVVAVSCTRDDIVVVYRRFTDAATRDAAYASLLDEAPDPDGAATSCADGAYRGSVTEDDRTWAVACWESSSGRVLVWTEPDTPVLGAILAPPSVDLLGSWQASRFVDATH